MAASEDDWQSTLTPLQRGIYLYEHPEQLSDITFEVINDATSDGRRVEESGGKAKTFKANKSYLAAASSVFKKMFFGAAAFEQKLVKISDVDARAFDILLRFVYMDDCKSQLSTDNVMAVVYAAKKYAMKRLLDGCEEFLVKNIAVEDAVFFSGQARLFGLETVLARCCSLIDQNAAKCFDSDSMALVDHQTLGMIIERDTLRIDELDLFRAVKMWALKKCTDRQLPPTKENVRNMLGDLLYKIRWPLISHKDLANPAGPASVLSESDMAELFVYLGGFPPADLKFNSRERAGERFVCAVYKAGARNVNVGLWDGCQRHDSIGIFSAARPVTIHGLTVPSDVWEDPMFSVYLSDHQDTKKTCVLTRDGFVGVPSNKFDGWTVCTLKSPQTLPSDAAAKISVECNQRPMIGCSLSDAGPHGMPSWLTVKPRKDGSRCVHCDRPTGIHGFIREIIVA